MTELDEEMCEAESSVDIMIGDKKSSTMRLMAWNSTFEISILVDRFLSQFY